MVSHLSVIKYVNNPLSNENIALGLIVLCGDKVYFKISDEKTGIVKKLNAKSSKLLEFSLKHLNDFISEDSIDQSGKLIKFKKKLDVDFLERLCNYSNGIVQISKPSPVQKQVDDKVFMDYFKLYIGEERVQIDEPSSISPMQQNIQNKLYAPLKDKIDVDYTLKQKQLPTLFFDFHFDGVGVNGAMYAAKSVDFNNKRIDQIRKDVSDYESVIERLNDFAKKKGITGQHQYYLIADPYNGSSPSYMDLYSILKQNNMPLFKLISSADLQTLVSMILRNNARKLSEELC